MAITFCLPFKNKQTQNLAVLLNCVLIIIFTYNLFFYFSYRRIVVL